MDEPSGDSHEVPLEHRARAAKRIVAVGGGKGGAGKSLIAANVAIYLATLGKKVVLLDADLGGANLHTFVGVERPRVTLGDLFEKRVTRVEDVVVETGVAGLGLVSGEGDPSWIANPRPAQKFRLLNQVQQLEVDYLVVDLGPGSGLNALDFFLLADVGLLVVLPEPTSVENTHRFLKSAFLRRLRRAGLERALTLLHEGDPVFEGGIPAPFDLYTAARETDAELADKLLAEMRDFRARIVVNQVRQRPDLDLGQGLVSAARRRLGIPVDYLGHVEQDDAVWLAVRKRRPLMIEHPESRAAKCIERIARRVLAMETEKPAPIQVRALAELTHYEVLEIDPATTDEEIRRAYRRVKEMYGQDSMVVVGLYARDRLAAVQLRIDEAYDTLMDAERRRAYDVALFPDGLPQRRRAAIAAAAAGEGEASPVAGTAGGTGPLYLGAERTGSQGDRTGPSAAVAAQAGDDGGGDKRGEKRPEEPPRPLPPEPAIGPETEFTGALLRQIREARGVDLHAIAAKTKIAIGHLRAIEDERFRTMPALVYVRGFLVEYARSLRLDIARVLATYLARFKAGRADADDRD